MSSCPKMLKVVKSTTYAWCLAPIVALLLFSTVGHALTPPIPSAELQKAADLIVRGEVLAVTCAPLAVEKNNCSTVTWYTATVRVDKIQKGKIKARQIPVVFRNVQFTKGCVGDADHVSRVGEQATYYLRALSDGTWKPLNWSAVVATQDGKGALPRCQ